MSEMCRLRQVSDGAYCNASVMYVHVRPRGAARPQLQRSAYKSTQNETY